MIDKKEKKVSIITGRSKGIGYACAKKLAKERFNIAILSKFSLTVIERLSYCIARSGVDALTRSLDLAWSKYNIICNYINPGPINTPMTKKWPKKIKQNLIMKFKIKRKSLGSAHDVSNACLFLASDNSNYIQGSEQNINDGLVI